MVKHIWSVLCKESKIEAETNNISIIDAYESLQFGINTEDQNYKHGGPLNLPFSFEIVSLFHRDKINQNEDDEEVINAVDPKGQQLGEFLSTIQFIEDSKRVRNIFKFPNIALTTSGTYKFQINTRNKKNNKRSLITEIPIDIEVTVNGQPT